MKSNYYWKWNGANCFWFEIIDKVSFDLKDGKVSLPEDDNFPLKEYYEE